MKEEKSFEQVLGRLIGFAGKVMGKRLGENFVKKGYQISPEQGIILAHLKLNEGVNQRSLSDFLFCDKTAMTRWIDSLETLNYVVRVPDKVDRRQNMIFLTKEGKKFVDKIKETAFLTEKQAIAGIDPNKVKICKEVLLQVRLNLEEK